MNKVGIIEIHHRNLVITFYNAVSFIKPTYLERHLFLSDFQIPDHNTEAISAVKKFILDFPPDTLHFVGDMLNFTKVGGYAVPEIYHTTIGDEIRMGREIIFDIVSLVRKLNPESRIIWYEGNHEYRLAKYLARNASELQDLDLEGAQVISLPFLFELKKHKIDWVPYYGTHREGEVEVEHGDVARSKSGYTAHSMLDKRGRSGLSGHTHKLSLVTRNQGGEVRFWIETGSLCNLEPSPRWMKKPDWVNGFAIGLYDPDEDLMHPTPILLQNNQFVFNNKVYKPDERETTTKTMRSSRTPS